MTPEEIADAEDSIRTLKECADDKLYFEITPECAENLYRFIENLRDNHKDA